MSITAGDKNTLTRIAKGQPSVGKKQSLSNGARLVVMETSLSDVMGPIRNICVQVMLPKGTSKKDYAQWLAACKTLTVQNWTSGSHNVSSESVINFFPWKTK